MKAKELLLKGESIAGNENYSLAVVEYAKWCEEIKLWAESENIASEKMRELILKMHYVENEYSSADGKKSLRKAINNVFGWLIAAGIENCSFLSPKMAHEILEKIIDNFYLYYRGMYLDSVHKKGTLQEEILQSIKIGNEYDLQRMLYAIILPLFPTARMEVNSDNGYGGIRADIYLDEYDLVIETKCTRSSMKEKKLLEELGADGFHYRSGTIFMFIYDKNCIITNPSAFQETFKREYTKDGKTIRAFVLQPTRI